MNAGLDTSVIVRYVVGVPESQAAAALDFLLAFVSAPGVRPTGAALQVLDRLVAGAHGAGLMDRLIHSDYTGEGLTFVTFDRAAARLPGAQLLTA